MHDRVHSGVNDIGGQASASEFPPFGYSTTRAGQSVVARVLHVTAGGSIQELGAAL